MPVAIATAQLRRDGRAFDVSTQATAKASVKSGANAAKTAMRPTTGKSTPITSAPAIGSPRAIEGQNLRP